MTRIIARPDAGGARGPLPSGWRGSGAVMGDTQSARVRAARILLDARSQARAIIAEAHATARQIAAAELDDARQRGYAEGFAQAQQELAPVAQRVALLAGQAATAHAESVRQLDETVLMLVMAIARGVVKHELQLSPDTILPVVRAALNDLSVESGVVLRLHPDDEALLRPHLAALGLPPAVAVALVADPEVTPGGCFVESESGWVDATIEQALELMERSLHEQLDVA